MGNDPIPGYTVTHLDDFWQEEGRAVLIVEDHALVRGGMRNVMHDVLPGVVVECLEAATCNEARRIIGRRREDLDLILLDINLPDSDSAEVMACLRNEWRALPVVVVSACEDWSLAVEFMKAGVLGFIPKSSNIDMLVSALRLVFAGGRYFPPEVLGLLASGYAGAGETEPDAETGEHSLDKITGAADLSPRQKEVLKLMLQGYANKEIARQLGVSVGTVKNYVSAILRSYGTNSRAKAVLAALNDGAEAP